ncbi:hypothetical protein DFJ43DRAFT_1043889 [Lentinula guzmanii]|uniref:YDG domain-containing protein n=1 Tax=Lentinula guzmanii TaxID=2804957 RepID=A0AA38J793_9AGAR|nr:hypothetical protein DFJ43DRAFT_1043889 [Lentinula guzmanii]
MPRNFSSIWLCLCYLLVRLIEHVLSVKLIHSTRNGEYENDVDNGLTISYTGAGGRINLFGKQKEVCMNQDWKTAPNRALLHAYRDRKPIRVIRGFKLSSAYAPKQGYRYDGLYRIYKVYTKVTNDSKKHRLCMYELQRLSDQDPPPWETTTADRLELKETGQYSS